MTLQQRLIPVKRIDFLQGIKIAWPNTIFGAHKELLVWR
jgi:hypothetical protein